MERLTSLLGLGCMLLLAWLLSSNRRAIAPRVVIGGLVLQFAFAALVLKTSPGQTAFAWLGDRFRDLLDCVEVGSVFLFGADYRQHYFAFKVLPTIIFFSAFMSVLYHYGIMQQVVRWMAVIMQRTLGTSGAESLSAAANIFIGQTEAPLVVRPYLAEMTNSELMAVMVGGFATIAGGVLAAYVGMGVPAEHLIAASVISAPAALLMAKMLEPELGRPKTAGNVEWAAPPEAVNVVHAVANGAADGVKLAINAAAMLIAFLALIALANALLGWMGQWFDQQWSIEGMFGRVFAPLAWVMGVEWSDSYHVGVLIGKKIAANEFVAYQELASWLQPDSPVRLTERSVVIATYALCGFANFGSIGIQIGGLGALAPHRQADLARLGVRAMIGGALASFMTACVAGMLV